jgi:hypothetical protein
MAGRAAAASWWSVRADMVRGRIIIIIDALNR